MVRGLPPRSRDQGYLTRHLNPHHVAQFDEQRMAWWIRQLISNL
jgi:hypothetical protein